MDTIEADFQRFSELHSWYKHCQPAGHKHSLQLRIGQQERNGIHTEVDDPEGLHWHFEPVSEDYKGPHVIINSFTHPKRRHCFNLIVKKYPDCKQYLTEHYAEEFVQGVYEENSGRWQSKRPYTELLLQSEHAKQMKQAKDSAAEYIRQSVNQINVISL